MRSFLTEATAIAAAAAHMNDIIYYFLTNSSAIFQLDFSSNRSQTSNNQIDDVGDGGGCDVITLSTA